MTQETWLSTPQGRWRRLLRADMCLSENLSGVKNLQVTEPTTSSLRVRWEPAEGDVRQYRIIYVPAAGGAESMVR